jgi:ABC-type nitrate/sulfonate/bicarbonate transport system substrate-binding protein
MGQLSRRSLLRSSAALGGLVVLSSCAPAAAPSPSASVAASAGPPSATPSPTATPTKAAGAWVALTSNQMLWPVALEAGYFKKYGQEFDLSYVAGSNNAMAAMLSGKIGLTSVAGSAVVTSAAGGEDVVMIAGFINKMIFRIMAMPGITSIDQLKGKTIAVTRIGTADYFAWSSVAKHQGWTVDKDLQFVAANDPPGQIAVLTSGKAAAIAVSPPNNILAETAGAHEVLDMATYNEPEQQVGIAVTRKYLAANRAAVTENMQATIEAIARWKKDPEFVKGVIKKYLKSSDQKFLDVGYSAYKDIFPQAPYPSEEAFQKVIDETAARSPKAKGLDPKKLIDRSIIEELEKSGFIKKLYGQ